MPDREIDRNAVDIGKRSQGLSAEIQKGGWLLLGLYDRFKYGRHKIGTW
jgi:hypothetical protein